MYQQTSSVTRNLLYSATACFVRKRRQNYQAARKPCHTGSVAAMSAQLHQLTPVKMPNSRKTKILISFQSKNCRLKIFNTPLMITKESYLTAEVTDDMILNG